MNLKGIVTAAAVAISVAVIAPIQAAADAPADSSTPVGTVNPAGKTPQSFIDDLGLNDWPWGVAEGPPATSGS